jgi:hypothetical protein
MIQIIGKFYFPDYTATNVNYGRIYMLESPEEIWERYDKARTSGSPKALLDYFLTQYYQSEFVNDSAKLLMYQKAMKIEPFVHKTDEQIGMLGDPQITLEKYYFNEWFVTVSEVDLLTKPEQELILMYKTYLNGKKIQGSSPEAV